MRDWTGVNEELFKKTVDDLQGKIKRRDELLKVNDVYTGYCIDALESCGVELSDILDPEADELLARITELEAEIQQEQLNALD